MEAFDVVQHGAFLGRFYLDMVPRDGKFNHAGCFTVRYGVTGIHPPQVALVCSFIDPNEPPAAARLDYGNVVKLFHEFGHLLHAILSGHGRWLVNTT